MRRVVEIALVCAGTLVAAVIVTLVILTVALPGVVHDARLSRETAAMKAITTIQAAQAQYYSNYTRYSVSLQELGPPANGAETAAAAGLIDRDLASGDKGGYKYTEAPTPTGYTVTAAPSQYPTSGSVTYFSDQSMGIHVHKGQEPATVNDPLLGETAPAQQSK